MTRILVMSGKMGSGKDTLAPLIMNAMGLPNARHVYYADPLKDESNIMFETIRKSENQQDATRSLEQLYSVPSEFSGELVSAVYEDLKDWSLTSRSRTPGIRKFLQLLGTDVRRTEDPDYWVRKATAQVERLISVGESVFLTDARFPNEVSSMRQLGAWAVRLEISFEEQERRLLARDGAMPSLEALTHPSETGLDGYTGFSQILLGDQLTVQEAVEQVVSNWSENQ